MEILVRQKKKNNIGFDSIELHVIEWSMKPLAVTKQFSSYFSDETKFPKGSVEFDSAMIIQGLEHS